MRRFAAALLLLALAFAMAATDAGAQKKGKGNTKWPPPPPAVEVGTIHHLEDLPAGAGKTFTVTCPPGWTVTSWDYAGGGDFRTRVIRVVRAKGGTAWTFSVLNLAFPPEVVTAGLEVICIRTLPPAPAAALTGNAPKIIIRIPPRQQTTGTATCPKGQVPAGESVEQGAGTTPRLAQASAAGAVGAVQITSALPSGRSMIFGLRNPGELEETVTVGVNCLRKTFKAGGETRSLQIKRGLFDVSVLPGDHLFTGRCSGGAILSTGFALPPDGRLSFFGASHRRNGVTLSLGNHTVQAEPAEIALLCTPGKTKFVKEG